MMCLYACKFNEYIMLYKHFLKAQSKAKKKKKLLLNDDHRPRCSKKKEESKMKILRKRIKMKNYYYKFKAIVRNVHV